MEWEETSPEDGRYNCIAFAADVKTKFYWPTHQPGLHWPSGLPRNETVETFLALYRSLGYEDCENGDIEDGYDKVAVFALFDGTPTHAAIFYDGKWRSKLGPAWDISHDLPGLNGDKYGFPQAFLKRKKKNK